MRHLYLYIIILLSLTAGESVAQKFSARLDNIRYYYDGEGEFPVSVHVCFSVTGCYPRTLKFVAKYDGNITSMSPVKLYDSLYAYYTFRTSLNMATTLDLVLENKDGFRSNAFTITALPTPENIIKIPRQ